VNDTKARDDEVTLELLDAIEQRSDLSQRDLAARLDIALGLTNSYLKRCARKGLVKVKEVPANRYLYYLTPKGFAEKSRLTARFLSTSLTFYREAAESCSAVYRHCEQRAWRRIVLCGASDLAEIACSRAAGHDVTLKGLYDPGYPDDRFLSLRVDREWERLPAVDAYFVTDLDGPLELYRSLRKRVSDPERLLVPRVLGLEGAIKNGH